MNVGINTSPFYIITSLQKGALTLFEKQLSLHPLDFLVKGLLKYIKRSFLCTKKPYVSCLRYLQYSPHPAKRPPRGHGFSLIEEVYATEVTDQASGTCWAHSAATSLESNFLYVQGVSVDIDPMDIVDATYGSIAHPDPDRDGFHPRQYSALNVGAGPLQTIAGLTDGIESGIVLTEASDYSGLTREQIQEVLRTNGAISISYADRSNDYYDIYGYTTLNNHNPDADHSVTLVGWDDDFPAEYFDPPAEENRRAIWL